MSDAYWIDWTDWDAANGTCSNSSYHSKSSCVSHGKIWTPKPHSTWNGCVNDRDQNNDVNNTATVAGAPATLFRAHQAVELPDAAMMPLSEDWTALNAKIDAMTPTGNTNVTIGLAWGFQLLSPNEPFNAPAPAPDLDKVIVMMTDGENTQNRWTSSSSSIDARTQKACDNVKAANIKLYTVRVIDGDVTLLKGCATKPTMYYDVQKADPAQQRVQLDRAEPREPAHHALTRRAAAHGSPERHGCRGANDSPRILRRRFERLFTQREGFAQSLPRSTAFAGVSAIHFTRLFTRPVYVFDPK